MSNLTKLFLDYAQKEGALNTAGVSAWISVAELDSYYQAAGISFSPAPGQKNGNSWCRASRLLAYVVERDYAADGSLESVRLAGFNTAAGSPQIKAEIKRDIRRLACAVLAANTGKVEVDHKSPWNSGTLEAKATKNKSTQRLAHFQPLTRIVNMVKREHCNTCISNKKRFDATCLGYSVSVWDGTLEFEPKSQGCKGCYWHDPIEFNKQVS